MANKAITQLPVALSLTGDEQTVVVQNGITKQASVSQIANAASPGKLITNMVYDPGTGDLLVYYSDGSSQVIGPISGFSGYSGLSGYSGISGYSGFSGYSGQQGTSINIIGSVATPADLPPTGSLNDAYIVQSSGHLYVWNGSAWNDVGPIVGPTGQSGISGYSRTPSGNPFLPAG